MHHNYSHYKEKIFERGSVFFLNSITELLFKFAQKLALHNTCELNYEISATLLKWIDDPSKQEALQHIYQVPPLLPLPGYMGQSTSKLTLQLGWAHGTVHRAPRLENDAWLCSLFTFHGKLKSCVLQLLTTLSWKQLGNVGPLAGEPLRKSLIILRRCHQWETRRVLPWDVKVCSPSVTYLV